MRILIINDQPYLPQAHGGIEWSTHELCSALTKRGHECAVLAPIKGADIYGLAIRVRRKLGLWGRYPSDLYLGYEVFRGWDLFDGTTYVTNKFKPNSIIVQGSNLRLASAAKLTNIPTFFFFRHSLYNLNPKDIPSNIDGFFANSEFIANQYLKLYNIASTVIRPLVSIARCRTHVNPKDALFFGLQTLKGGNIVLDLAESRPDINFRIVETWTMNSKVTGDLKQRALLLRNVTVSKPRNDVKHFFSSARLILVPTIAEEAWGRVVTEGQVNGIPALTSNRGGLPEAVGDGGTCLDPAQDFKIWLEQFSKYWDDPSYYYVMRDRALAASKRDFLQEDAICANLITAMSS